MTDKRITRRGFLEAVGRASAATAAFAVAGPRVFAQRGQSVPGGQPAAAAGDMEQCFRNPPDSARPGVYWYFMDGNLSGDEMVKDLESMREVGIGNLVFLEVNVGVPRGPVKFMSRQWQELFTNAVRHAERLGIDITLGAGPGWCGSGGPWVKPAEAMQHLDFSTVDVTGPAAFDGVLPVPAQRSTRWHRMRSDFYEDVVVYAFPSRKPTIDDINEKALYERDPYSSKPGVKAYLPSPACAAKADKPGAIDPDQIVDLTGRLRPGGRLKWDVPAGEWTIMRMGRRPTGASSRPAPVPGEGLEHDKFDPAALDDHWKNYCGKLLSDLGPRSGKHGWTTVHLDSWEMGAQNWTPKFREEFKRRRGYDPFPFVIAYSGRAVRSVEQTERFLWDVRLTGQELVLENYAGHLKELAHKHGFDLSIEPYDMNPTADLDLGAVADVPMCEFWSAGYGFDSSYSCIEATSVAHVMGRPIVSAEAFTAGGSEKWQQYPWSMKNQGDWALCMGINRFVYHTFAHKPLGDAYRPGMTMGPYGVHWDRGQTWWPMAAAYHRYVTRCSHLLRQGVTVSDILYLTPEGAPMVFRPPASALAGTGPLADKKGYGFDGCSPKILIARAEVKDGRIVFPGGTSYRVLVLPRFATMTPALLKKITELVKAGATVVGAPPVASPSLSDYPQCDTEVQELAAGLWGEELSAVRWVGKGRVILDLPAPTDASPPAKDGAQELYLDYETTTALLVHMGEVEDFQADGPVRFTHRRTPDKDIYFVSNTSDAKVDATCRFRVAGARPQLWDPVTAQIRPLPQFKTDGQTTAAPMTFEPYQSFFVVFDRDGKTTGPAEGEGVNFPAIVPAATLEGAWEVSFDPQWGGPEKITFEMLVDWTTRPERGIKYYSGIATYRKTFDLPKGAGGSIFLDLGTVHDMARVRLNGKDLGVVWCAPWRVEITDGVKAKDNVLEVEIANRWPNRLLGDRQPPDKDSRTVKWESGLLGGKTYKAGRYTFATTSGPNKLLASGLLGPVRILVERK